MDFNDYKNTDLNCAMHTYARFDVCIESGSGAVATDCDGKKYIDFGSGIGVNSLGYCDEGWADAVCAQAKKLSHTSNLYYNTATVKLEKKLVSYCNMSRVFLANSGAEANECAIKAARKYSFDKYGNGRNEIITINNSFHGRTMNTLKATAQQVLHPDCFAPYPEGFCYADNNIESVKQAMSEKTCAVMLELIQGEGGVLPQDKEFVDALSVLCNAKDILLIIDEVQTGIARTGKLLCCENYGVIPDIVTLAKGLGGGLPIGACLVGEKLKDTMTPSSHGSTFGGNPIACAGAEYVIDTVNNEQFLSDVARKGEVMRNAIKGFKNVKSVRGLGMMIGIEVDGKTGADVVKRCIEKGLIVLSAKTLVRLLPPLNITDEQILDGLEILKSVIEE